VEASDEKSQPVPITERVNVPLELDFAAFMDAESSRGIDANYELVAFAVCESGLILCFICLPHGLMIYLVYCPFFICLFFFVYSPCYDRLGSQWWLRPVLLLHCLLQAPCVGALGEVR
jgi:hypothetical protein